MNSNTTLVKVKYVKQKFQKQQILIQIQHLLKLNCLVRTRKQEEKQIQIQHLLKLNWLFKAFTSVINGFKYNTC